MNAKELLKTFVEAFYLSEKIGGELAFSDEVLPVSGGNISGQLLQFYQHLRFEEDCFFGNTFFNIVLLPIDSEARNPEYLGLDYFDKWQEKHYEIFAQTLAEDLIFCDVGDENCPVYGLISGGNEMLRLSNSLFEFLDFYIALTKLQTIDFEKNTHEANWVLRKDFEEKIHLLITEKFSTEVKAGLVNFVLN